MVNAKDIIDYILDQRPYNKIKTFRECQKIVSMLGKNKAAMVKFAIKKNKSFMLAVRHPLCVQELKNDISISQIKFIIKKFVEVNPQSELAEVVNIVVFVAKSVAAPKKYKPDNLMPRLNAKPKGNFKNLAKDKEIYRFFEKIRQLIKARNGVNR